jgi:hypothetical protein
MSKQRAILVFWTCALVWGASALLRPSASSAQGFNWQYSARFPTDYPTLFIGVQGGYSPFALNAAELLYAEPLASGGVCECARFTSAVGADWRVGISVESWTSSGVAAWYGTLGFQRQSETFQTPGDSLKGRVNPQVNASGDFTTEYIFAHDLLHLTAEFGVKYKFYPTPLFASVGVSAGYARSQNNRLVERATNVNYNYEREWEGDFYSAFPLAAAAVVRIGGDAPLAKGVYASPAVFAAWQFRAVEQSPSLWSRLALGVQATVFFSLR